MRRFITFRSLLVLSIVLLWPQMSEAASVSEILGKARQANARARGLKNGSVDDKVQAIQILGPVTLEFVGASDLAHAAKSQRSTVRETCDTLKDPLEDIYNSAFSQINSMSKSVMDQDGDLEALYETKAWKDSQLVASQSLYFLNWLRYICSFVENSKQRKEMLQKAADGFSEFAVGEQGSQLKRESLFGRALAEKELRQYDWAIRDFEILLKDPGLPRDMEQKVRSSLADARSRRAKGGGQKDEDEGPSEPSPDDIAKAMLDKAQSLFDRSQRERGDKREKTRWEGIAYIEEVRKKGGEWEKRADALAKREMTAQETAQLEEEKNPFVPWKQATEYLQKNQYSRAIPLLKEVVASDDARAKAHRKEALYFLSVGHFQQADYRAALARLDDFFAKDGVPQQYADDAAYLRFKSAEALYASTKTPSEATIKLYVDATKNYIRRYPTHKSVFEAYFRLGEYEHSQKNYLAAAEQYQKVKGDLPFQVRADYAELQSYFALQDALDQ
ncbi:MAG: tetratricopeptide repeat protein, partial [Candidatus Binatia bacterium]